MSTIPNWIIGLPDVINSVKTLMSSLYGFVRISDIEDGFVWASRDLVMERTSFSRSTYYRNVRLATERGLLRRASRFVGDKLKSGFELAPDSGPAFSARPVNSTEKKSYASDDFVLPVGRFNNSIPIVKLERVHKTDHIYPEENPPILPEPEPEELVQPPEQPETLISDFMADMESYQVKEPESGSGTVEAQANKTNPAEAYAKALAGDESKVPKYLQKIITRLKAITGFEMDMDKDYEPTDMNSQETSHNPTQSQQGLFTEGENQSEGVPAEKLKPTKEVLAKLLALQNKARAALAGRMGKKCRATTLTPGIKKQITARIREGYTLEQLVYAAEWKCKHADERGWIYSGSESFWARKSVEHVIGRDMDEEPTKEKAPHVGYEEPTGLKRAPLRDGWEVMRLAKMGKDL